jgi:hypothetical protein
MRIGIRTALVPGGARPYESGGGPLQFSTNCLVVLIREFNLVFICMLFPVLKKGCRYVVHPFPRTEYLCFNLVFICMHREIPKMLK